MRVSAFVSPQLQAVLLAVKGLDKEIRKQNRQQLRQNALPMWQREVAEHVQSRLDRLVLSDTARVAVSDQNVQLQAARIGRKLGGGLLPREDWQGVEFGADQNTHRGYEATRNGKTFTVHRHTTRQLPRRNPKGRVIYPSVENIVPRILSLWIQTTIRTLGEALHG
jgi:hypothetical protein